MALEVERKYFESIRAKLVADHEGKYALIHGERLLGVFDTADLAYERAVAELGNVPVLIEPIRSDPDHVDVAPALMLGAMYGSS